MLPVRSSCCHLGRRQHFPALFTISPSQPLSCSILALLDHHPILHLCSFSTHCSSGRHLLCFTHRRHFGSALSNPVRIALIDFILCFWLKASNPHIVFLLLALSNRATLLIIALSTAPSFPLHNEDLVHLHRFQFARTGMSFHSDLFRPTWNNQSRSIGSKSLARFSPKQCQLFIGARFASPHRYSPIVCFFIRFCTILSSRREPLWCSDRMAMPSRSSTHSRQNS